MPALLIQHRVTDFGAWELGFTADAHVRHAHGCRHTRLFRDARNPTHLLILLDWDSLERARFFALSDDVREAFARAEVVGDPIVWLLEEFDQPAHQSEI